jgi:hypothetical protein
VTVALFRRQQLADVNTSLPDIIASQAWRGWPAPLNAVAGEQHYQEQIYAAAGARLLPHGHLTPVAVTLERDGGNEYDSNAVRALVNGQHVGHLRRPVAAQLGPAMDKAKIATGQVVGLLRGGASKGNVNLIGVHLWLNRILAPLPAITMQVHEELLVSWPPWAHEGKPDEWEWVYCPECDSGMVREAAPDSYTCECWANFTR